MIVTSNASFSECILILSLSLLSSLRKFLSRALMPVFLLLVVVLPLELPPLVVLPEKNARWFFIKNFLKSKNESCRDVHTNLLLSALQSFSLWLRRCSTLTFHLCCFYSIPYRPLQHLRLLLAMESSLQVTSLFLQQNKKWKKKIVRAWIFIHAKLNSRCIRKARFPVLNKTWFEGHEKSIIFGLIVWNFLQMNDYIFFGYKNKLCLQENYF